MNLDRRLKVLEEQKVMTGIERQRRVLVLWSQDQGETESEAIERTKLELGLTDEEFARATRRVLRFTQVQDVDSALHGH